MIERLELADALYEKHGRPLEKDHWGEYLVIAEDGRTVVGANREEVSVRGRAEFGDGAFEYKIGELSFEILRWFPKSMTKGVKPHSPDYSRAKPSNRPPIRFPGATNPVIGSPIRPSLIR